MSEPNIITTYDPKPIPDRRFDWSAIDDNTYDGHGCCIGYGATEQETIDDLADQEMDRCVDCGGMICRAGCPSRLP